jgi:hypothetical protein
VDALVSQSLLRQEEIGGEPRIMMLETIREYALERLEERARWRRCDGGMPRISWPWRSGQSRR